MDDTISKEFPAGGSATVTYTSAGQSRTLPAALVRDIARSVPAAPVPFAPAAYEGLVDTDHGLAAQLDLTQALGGPGRSGDYGILVGTAAGLIRIRVDAVALAGTPSSGAAPSGLAEIEALIAGLAPAEPGSEARAAPAEIRPPQSLDVLIVGCGGTPLALPAVEIERIERHRGARGVRTGPDAARIVTLEDDVVPGWSLTTWLGAAAGQEEGWAVVVRAGGRRAALLVGESYGVASVPLDRVRCLRHGDRDSVWLLDARHGMIEVIETAEIIGRPERPVLAAIVGPDRPIGPDRVERRATERGLLAVAVGPFTCVFRGETIAEVLEGGRDRLSDRRSPTACPSCDAAMLLGGSGLGAGPGRTLVLKRPGRRALALLVPDVGQAASTPEWQPLPVVPRSVRSLFRSVRLRGTACDFLVRESAFGRLMDPAIAGLLRQAQTGWLELDATAPADPVP